jgi:RNA polymerase sigma factor (sigma-70 family)
MRCRMLTRETLEALIRGERAAFAEFERTYAHVVRRVVSTYWRGAFDREEAMQEVWLHIWKNRGAIDVERAEQIGGFISVVARRRCLDLLRGPAKPVSLDDIPEPVAESIPDVAEQGQITAAVLAFTSRLRPQWKAFFDLHFVQGLPYEDVAVRLGINKLRCKYMKKVLSARARDDEALTAALSRTTSGAPRAS